MRPSPQRHTLAVLRTLIGLTQKEMAALARCSVPTIQAIELGRLKLSFKLADFIADQAGLDRRWLLSNDVTQPPIDWQGHPFTREQFEYHQAAIFRPPQDSDTARVRRDVARDDFLSTLRRLAILYALTHRQHEEKLGDYRVNDALETLLDQYGGVEKLSPEDLVIWKSYPSRNSKLGDFVAVIERFLKQTEATYRDHKTTLRPAAPSSQHATAKTAPKKEKGARSRSLKTSK